MQYGYAKRLTIHQVEHRKPFLKEEKKKMYAAIATRHTKI